MMRVASLTATATSSATATAPAEMIATSGQLLVVLGVIGAGGAAVMFAVVTVKRRRRSVGASLRSLQRGTVVLFLGAVLLAVLGAVVVSIV